MITSEYAYGTLVLTNTDTGDTIDIADGLATFYRNWGEDVDTMLLDDPPEFAASVENLPRLVEQLETPAPGFLMYGVLPTK